MSTWRKRRDAVVEEYLQRANGDVNVAIRLITDAIRELATSSDGERLLTLLEAQERLQKQKELTK